MSHVGPKGDERAEVFRCYSSNGHAAAPQQLTLWAISCGSMFEPSRIPRSERGLRALVHDGERALDGGSAEHKRIAASGRDGTEFLD
jgi:hypothetical protein